MPCNPVDRHVGRAVARERLIAGASVSKCALALGLSEDAYLAKETGNERFTAIQLFTLSKLLDVPISSFYSKRGH